MNEERNEGSEKIDVFLRFLYESHRKERLRGFFNENKMRISCEHPVYLFCVGLRIWNMHFPESGNKALRVVLNSI